MLKARNSLRQKLLLWLVVPQLVFWLVGAILFYRITIDSSNRIIDSNLYRSAAVLVGLVQKKQTGTLNALSQPIEAAKLLGKVPHLDAIHYSIQDSQGQILSESARLRRPAEQSCMPFSYFDLQLNGRKFRAVCLYVAPTPEQNGYSVLVASSTQVRDEAEDKMALYLGGPLLLLMLATVYLSIWAVNRQLIPLTLLTKQVEERKPQDLSPLQITNAPDEISALSSAMSALLKTTEESVGRQRRFIADAAHQLRTPLAGLKSQTELAMRETTPEGLRERLNMVHTSATRSIHLVNQLLTLARSEPGNPNGIPKVRMDLARTIRDLTAELVPRALAARMDLGCDCLTNEAWIDGNSALLRELFINLVENAIKYIPRDSCITVRLTEDETHYIVDVEDNGPGIPDNDKDRVFERFYRREQSGSGCGLGMAIVREIVERHNGTVTLLDADPHGLIVHVILPKNL